MCSEDHCWLLGILVRKFMHIVHLYNYLENRHTRGKSSVGTECGFHFSPLHLEIVFSITNIWRITRKSTRRFSGQWSLKFSDLNRSTIVRKIFKCQLLWKSVRRFSNCFSVRTSGCAELRRSSRRLRTHGKERLVRCRAYAYLSVTYSSIYIIGYVLFTSTWETFDRNVGQF